MKSIKLITEDRPGVMADIVDMLAQEQINIQKIEGETVDRYAVFELIVDRLDDAMRLLQNRGLQAVSDDLITIRIADQPGALARVTRDLRDAKLSLRGISTLQRQDGYCFVALSTDNDAVARKLLRDVLL
ncbi:MAG TPA: ACT domain-containing protein [Noviherbaspirillum sp.]